MNVNQYLMINLEIVKDIQIGDKIAPQVKFEMLLPHGIAWHEAELVCDEFKQALMAMKKQQEDANAAAQQAAADDLPETVTPEVVSA